MQILNHVCFLKCQNKIVGTYKTIIWCTVDQSPGFYDNTRKELIHCRLYQKRVTRDFKYEQQPKCITFTDIVFSVCLRIDNVLVDYVDDLLDFRRPFYVINYIRV